MKHTVSTTLDTFHFRHAHCRQVLQNTFSSASTRHVSAGLSRPYSVKVSGVQMGHCASVAARLNSCFEHLHTHPSPLQNGKGGSQTLVQEPETMTRNTAGMPGPVAHSGDTIPHRFACRIARQFIVRAAVRGHLDWPTALRVLRKLEGGAA